MSRASALPYASATSGAAAREEITKLLRRFGCESVGFKGQITAIECGILPFEAVFLPYMLAADGRPMIETLREQRLLPAPTTVEGTAGDGS